jgi:hypothetical protein
MVETDLGRATIVYEDPNEGTVEKTVQNEHIAYFQDHWLVKTGEDERGHDVVRRIPATRVYYVERSVEEFEREVKTLRDQVQSFTDDLRTRILGGGGGRGTGGDGSRGGDGGSDVVRIDVESGDSDEDGGEDEERPGTRT